jgi:signal transduction histidine kinase
VATGLYEDRAGNVWVGGHDGLLQITPNGVKRWTQQDGLASDLVFTMCEGSEGTLWVGTFNGLSRLSAEGIETFREAEGFPAPAVWCLYRDRQQQVWAGTPRGLVRVSDEGFEVLNHDNSGLSHNDVRSISEDAQGRLWVGTSYGLNRWEDGRFTNFLESASGQPFDIVTALHGDEAGDLWIGTMEGGLARYRDGEFTVYNRETGLYDDLIFSILEDGAGSLWMSCNRGVFRVSKADLNAHAEGLLPRVDCQVYGVHDGLPSVECNGTFQPAGLRSRDGRLWFPTARGVGVIDPQRLSRNERPPPVLIERLQVNGNTVSVPVSAELGPGVGELVIHYTALSFVAPENVRFQYRLDGLDPDWVAETEVRSARYAQLPPGDYRFQVIACNNEGVWNREGAVLAFTVSPYWWQTGWFRWVAVMGTLGSVGATARFWTVQSYRRRMARLEREHALERERNRIATDLHDDVGSNLGTIALLSESAQRGAEGEAAREFAEIHQLAASTADAMRDIVWFIDTGENELQALALRMKETAERLLASVTWEFVVQGTLPRCQLSTEFKRHFLLIFKESLHNIRKHAEATRVRLELGVTDGRVRLVVSDNGIGLQPTAELAGLGLMSMRRRAETQGWDLVLGPGADGGTVVRLGAPLP